jgi:hypothetical protein
VEGGALRADAPVVFTDLEPLREVRLVIGGCRSVTGSYRVSKRKVDEGSQGDQVTISVEPA